MRAALVLLLLFAFALMAGPKDSGQAPVRALDRAEEQFDAARQSYSDGKIAAGDDHLDQMSKALDQMLAALAAAHKSHLYKRPEQRVATLQRRMQSLLEEISIEQRGWAEQTSRHLSEVRDKLLAGALGK